MNSLRPNAASRKRDAVPRRIRALDRKRPGVTLVELLVAIAVTGLLIGLLSVAVARLREAANRTICVNHLKQMGLAFHRYYEDHDSLPPGNRLRNVRYSGHSWGVYLLPYLGFESVYANYDFTQIEGGNPYNNRLNGQLLDDALVSVYQCPSSPTDRWSSQPGVPGRYLRLDYAGVSGSVNAANILTSPSYPGYKKSLGGVLLDIIVDLPANLPNGSVITWDDIGDGRSNTMLVVEQSDHCRDPDGTIVNCQAAYHSPGITSIPFNMGPCCTNVHMTGTAHLTTVLHPIGFKSGTGFGVRPPFPHSPIQSAHLGRGANVLFCDGSVRWLIADLGIPTLYSLAERNDGNAIAEEF